MARSCIEATSWLDTGPSLLAQFWCRHPRCSLSSPQKASSSHPLPQNTTTDVQYPKHALGSSQLNSHLHKSTWFYKLTASVFLDRGNFVNVAPFVMILNLFGLLLHVRWVQGSHCLLELVRWKAGFILHVVFWLISSRAGHVKLQLWCSFRVYMVWPYVLKFELVFFYDICIHLPRAHRW